jgi:hypothetical protein
VQAAVRLDGARWLAAADEALAAPLRPGGQPDRIFRLRCEDLAGAIAALARDGGRLLESLAWRGTEPAAGVADWRPDQVMEVPARALARANPWGGLPGCVYLGRPAQAGGFEPTLYLAGRGEAQAVCADPALAGPALAAVAGGRDASAARPLAATPARAGRQRRGRRSGLERAARAVGAPGSARHAAAPVGHALPRLHRAARIAPGGWFGATAEAEPTGYRFGPNRIELDGAVVDVGFSVDLTIDPALQALAQKTAACYTGQQAACRALGIARREDAREPIGHRLLERAMVRMAAIAIIDIDSGRIEALAGALSPCARQEADGPGRGAGCDPRLPYPVRHRPDALLNPAVWHDALPASTIKPIQALAFLTDPRVGPRWLQAELAATRPGQAPAGGLRAELMRSASKAFLDRMFCTDQGHSGCERPARVQQAAQRLGWNGACPPGTADGSSACGRGDLLFGRPLEAVAEDGRVRPLSAPVAYGRLLVEPADAALGTAFRLMPDPSPRPAALRECAAGGDGRRGTEDDWEKCRAATAVDPVAEGWGQGNARSTALGGAGMLAALGAAANGRTEWRRPHLVRGLRGVGARGVPLESAVLRWGLAPPQPLDVPPEAAAVILDGLSWSHRAGTARLGCEQVLDPGACGRVDWIAGKTGTPTFPNDERSLDELARRCRGEAARRDVACGPLRPYKWYVAAWRPPGGDGRWTKAIGVLAERNWIARTGRIHGAGDQGPNPAVEIALQIAARQVGALPQEPRR